jgi:hypothetical protein
VLNGVRLLRFENSELDDNHLDGDRSLSLNSHTTKAMMRNANQYSFLCSLPRLYQSQHQKAEYCSRALTDVYHDNGLIITGKFKVHQQTNSFNS